MIRYKSLTGPSIVQNLVKQLVSKMHPAPMLQSLEKRKALIRSVCKRHKLRLQREINPFRNTMFMGLDSGAKMAFCPNAKVNMNE